MTKKAEYEISSSVNDGILEIIMTGELPASAYSDIMRDMIDIIQTNNVKKVLVDVSAVKGRLSITDIYSRVRSYPPSIYKIHSAMVNNNGLGDFERFHETTANNAGQSLKWFTNINAAREWLKSKSNKK